MTREELVKQHGARWQRLAALVRDAESGFTTKRLGPAGLSEMSRLYRGLASDLMRVRRDKLGADLERHLDQLASRAHNAIYAGTSVGQQASFATLLVDFPGALRRNLRFFGLACLLFFGVGLVAGIAAFTDESYALSVMSPEQLSGMEQMHGHSGHTGRASDANAMMTSFYVFNNVGIAFRCFATGIVFGIGPLYFLIFNGLHIGVALGHLLRVGHGPNILSFISSHGPWELTAIVISGGAGIQMGYALVATYGRTRMGNLRAHGLELLRQVAGAAAFLILAAAIEGWYSPSGLSNEVKYVTGAVGWVLVAYILFVAGRRRAVPEDAVGLRGARG